MLLRCDKVLVDGQLSVCDIQVKCGRIAALGQNISDENSIDLYGLTVLPGLIDSHIHGFAGFDTMDADEEALKSMSKALLKAGVTAFLPTTMTAFAEDICKALSVAGGLVGERTGGAKILGVFAEGPFISEEHRGAQPLQAIFPVDFELLEKMISSSKHSLRKVILAPELPDAQLLCQTLCENNIIPAMGHSSATYEESCRCINAGATVAVHSFNGMRPLHHREPGILGAVMGQDDVYAELIFDCIHVHPQSAKLLLRCKGSEKVVLVSDCMRAGGMPDGQYMLGDTKTFVRGGIARTAEGNLAGSTLKLIDGVHNLVEQLAVPLEDAVKMASETPAKALGLFHELGSISVGKAADIIAVDKEHQVRFAMVDGEVLLNELC